MSLGRRQATARNWPMMNATSVYDVSGSDDTYRCYLLHDDSNVAAVTERAWGTMLASTWKPPKLTIFSESCRKPDANFRSLYVPGLLIAQKSATDIIQVPDLELLPVIVGDEERFLLNPLITLHRFQEQGARMWRLPTGLIIQIDTANFYAEDVPMAPRMFWLHDGRFPRFLLCNEPFRALVQSAQLTGLSFKLLGQALT
jgi:hypothetical protein